MKAQKIQLNVGMNKYMPLEIVTHTGNKGTVAAILIDKRTGCVMALGMVESKTHGNIPVAWNMYGESTDRVSSKGIGNTPPLKDLCIAEIITEIPAEQNESDLFKQAFNEAEKANGIEFKTESKPKANTKVPVVNLPEEIKNHLERLKEHIGGNVEVKAYVMDSSGKLVSIDNTDSDIVH